MNNNFLYLQNALQDMIYAKTKADSQRPNQEFTPGNPTANLRANLISEEASEVVEALRSGSTVDLIKELCDLLVVILGTVATYGIEASVLEDAFVAVHIDNRNKVINGTVRADGKLQTPEDHPKLDLGYVLSKQVDFFHVGYT